MGARGKVVLLASQAFILNDVKLSLCDFTSKVGARTLAASDLVGNGLR